MVDDLDATRGGAHLTFPCAFVQTECSSKSSGADRPGYNEQTQRKIPVDRSEAWEERLVVLKRGRVEIYDDWVRAAPVLNICKT
jgi:hypothetical protein